MRFFGQLLFSLLLILLTSSVFVAQQEVMPRNHLIDKEIYKDRLTILDDYLTEAVKNEIIPGGEFLILHDGQPIYHKVLGIDDPETGRNYQKGDIYRIASMTKTITIVAILQLWESGKLGLDDPLAMYIPAFAATEVLDSFNPIDSSYTTIPQTSPITLRHLMAHTSGIYYGDFEQGARRAIFEKNGMMGLGLSHDKWSTEELVNKIAAQPLAHQPGTQWTYGLNMEVLGRVVEVVSQQSLDKYLRDHILDPLQMSDTQFYIPKTKYSRLTKVHMSNKQGKLELNRVKELEDFPKWEGLNHFAGGGGLTSTAEDYAKFCQMLLNDGVYRGKRILGKRATRLLHSDQIPHLRAIGKGSTNLPGFSHGFGVFTIEPGAEGLGMYTIGAFGKGGYLNTKSFVDPNEKLVFVGMTQVVPFYHPGFWDRLYAIVYSLMK